MDGHVGVARMSPRNVLLHAGQIIASSIPPRAAVTASHLDGALALAADDPADADRAATHLDLYIRDHTDTDTAVDWLRVYEPTPTQVAGTLRVAAAFTYQATS